MTMEQHFRVIGSFDEADTLESSSIQIYSELHTGLYTQLFRCEATLIKGRLNGDYK
jgi:hypothetical protein